MVLITLKMVLKAFFEDKKLFFYENMPFVSKKSVPLQLEYK